MYCLVMALACLKPLPLYRPRDPRASDLWRLMDQHFDSFRQVYDERYQAKHVSGDLLKITGARCPGDGARVP